MKLRLSHPKRVVCYGHVISDIIALFPLSHTGSFIMKSITKHFTMYNRIGQRVMRHFVSSKQLDQAKRESSAWINESKLMEIHTNIQLK